MTAFSYVLASVDDYHTAKDNFDTLQATFGDKMTVTPSEFDDIFSLICMDPSEHFELFDSYELGKVDVMEVFAVVIVYCKAPVEVKVPLLFDLFDFDHSQEISQCELVLLMLCTTRGLCKVVGLDRPDTEELEKLANDAFSSIDCDHSGQISLQEFSTWALHETSVVKYLTRFASTRVIYENQLQYDKLLQQICASFVHFAIDLSANNDHTQPPANSNHPKELVCSTGTCKEIIKRHCPGSTDREIDYLVQAMQISMQKASNSSTTTHIGSVLLPELISISVFCTVVASYVAFIVADEDHQHLIDQRELKVLLWLIRGKEPSASIVESFMKSLDKDHNGMLSAMEWVTYAIETDNRTGNLSFTTQLQLLFTGADRNGDAMLTLEELAAGLTPIITENLFKSGHKGEKAILSRTVQRRNSQITSLITGLANELMLVLDRNKSQKVEWFEFRQQLDYLEERIQQTKSYIHEFILPAE